MGALLTGKSNKASVRFLQLLYQAVQWANVADNARDPIGNIYYGLQQAVANSGLDQNTNEASYPGYARQAVARSKTGHVLNGQGMTLGSALTFPRANDDAEQEVSYFHTGAAVSGVGEVFHFGPLDPPVLVRKGVAVQMLPETIVAEY